jgi:hypothetical protein
VGLGTGLRRSVSERLSTSCHDDIILPRQAWDNRASESTYKRDTLSAAALGVDYETAVSVAVELLSFEFPAGAINASSKL